MKEEHGIQMIWTGGIIILILIVGLFVNLSSTDNPSSGMSKQETYLRLQSRPSKLIQ
tara:strand:- start:4355 stop:4525 length:171 start_codon:yes stop_codon:yes gene_type:complete